MVRRPDTYCQNYSVSRFSPSPHGPVLYLWCVVLWVSYRCLSIQWRMCCDTLLKRLTENDALVTHIMCCVGFFSVVPCLFVCLRQSSRHQLFPCSTQYTTSPLPPPSTPPPPPPLLIYTDTALQLTEEEDDGVFHNL